MHCTAPPTCGYVNYNSYKPDRGRVRLSPVFNGYYNYIRTIYSYRTIYIYSSLYTFIIFVYTKYIK